MPDPSVLISTVDARIFPIQIVQYALYVLSGYIDGQIIEQNDDKAIVKLWSSTALAERELEQTWNQTLLATSVNEHIFQTSGPIRNFLAQTALSITTQTQKTINEVVAERIGQRDIEHSGAPVHINIPPPSVEEEKDSPLYHTQVNKEGGFVDIAISPHAFLVSDVLWAAHQVSDVIVELVLNQPGNVLVAKLKAKEPTTELESLVNEFMHWLNIAAECKG